MCRGAGILLVNLPLGVVALLVAAWVMPDSARLHAAPLDRGGFAGLAVTFGGVTALGAGPARPQVLWVAIVVGVAVVAVAGVLSVRHPQRRPHPLVWLKQRSNS